MTARRGVVLANPRSGAGTDLEHLRHTFAGHDVIECHPDTLDRAIADVLDGEPGFVGMAGGDGSMRTLASRLAGTAVPMLTIPEGTRNHLARDLGITTVEEAAAAAARGASIEIDVGDVNGEVFVNTLSFGTYPAMVRDRRRRQRRWPKPVANLLAAAHQLRAGRRHLVEVDGVSHRVWAVFVGNGRYGTNVTDLTSRDNLRDGRLDVRIVRADQRFGRARVVLATLTGRLERSPLVELSTTATASIDPGGDHVEVALDGEVVPLTTPLEVTCRPRALTVLIPPDAAGEADTVTSP